MAVPPEDAVKYGVIEVAERIDERLVRASRIVEKPPLDQVPSNLAAVAGYVLTPDIFGYLEHTGVGQGGEIWLADGVQKIAALGITAVELMPVAEFPGSRNWGYDGVYPFAVEKDYGGVRALRRFVRACHERGLAVALDVVVDEADATTDVGREQQRPCDSSRYRQSRAVVPVAPGCEQRSRRNDCLGHVQLRTETDQPGNRISPGGLPLRRQAQRVPVPRQAVRAQ